MGSWAKGIIPIALSFIPGVGPFLAIASAAYIGASEQRAAKRRALAEYNASLRDQTVLVKGGVNPRPLVYGRTAIGGQLIYAETIGSKKEHLLMVVALAHGEVDAIETVYFNEQALTLDGSGNVTTAPYYISGTDPAVYPATVPSSGPYNVTLPVTPTAIRSIQDGAAGAIWSSDMGAPPVLTPGSDYTLAGNVVTFSSAFAGHAVQIVYEYAVSASRAQVLRFTGSSGQDISSTMIGLGAPSWTSADKCSGFALLVVRLTYAEDVWPAGIPNIKAVMRGRRVYDPRSSTTAWSANAALCARDYLTFLYGIGASGSKVDDTATNAAANICDEDVQLTASPATYQDRYTFDGAVSTGTDRRSNLRLFADAMAGSVNYSQGKWRLRAGAYTAPAISLADSQVLAEGGVQISPFASRKSLINGCKGSFLNAAAGYIEDQFTEWSNSGFITEDGGAAMTATISLPQVTDSARAQRLAKILVYRTRESLTLAVRADFSTYAWQVGEMVSVTLARYGFSAKPFRVIERGFSPEGGMRYLLREEPGGIYDWNLGEASILTGAANTNLPNPTQVAAPTITGITSAQWLYRAADGTFVARIRVAVTPPNDEYVLRGGKLQLQYKRGDWSQDWTLVETEGNATAIWIDPAFDGQNYLIRARARNSAGYFSAWSAVQVHTCIGRPGVVNLCLNSDFTQDLGYGTGTYSDARALRNWTADYINIGPVNIGRNYAGGTGWNVGRGGAWMFNVAQTAGAFYTIRQRVPIAPNIAYELSVYCSAHRCPAYLYLRWMDSSYNTISDAQGAPDTMDAGAGVIGDAQNPTSTHRRLWRSGTSPVNAAYAEIILLKLATTSGQTDSYAFWSKVMFCVAPAGVTKETATPWVDDALNTINGGIIIGGTVTTVAEQKPTPGYFTIDGFDNTYSTPGLSWTNDQPGIVTCSFHCSMQVMWDYTGGGSTMPDAVYFDPYVRIGSTYYLGTGVGDHSASIDIKPLAAETVWMKVDQNFSLPVAAGATVVFGYFVTPWRGSAPTANDTRIYHREESLQIQAIKK